MNKLYDTEAVAARPDPVEHLHNTYLGIVQQLTHENASLQAALVSRTAYEDHLQRQIEDLAAAYDKLRNQANAEQPVEEDETIKAAREESEVLNHG